MNKFFFIFIFLFSGCSILDNNITTLDGYYAQVSVNRSCVGNGKIRNIPENVQYLEIQEKREPSIFNSAAITYTKTTLYVNTQTNLEEKVQNGKITERCNKNSEFIEEKSLE